MTSERLKELQNLEDQLRAEQALVGEDFSLQERRDREDSSGSKLESSRREKRQLLRNQEASKSLHKSCTESRRTWAVVGCTALCCVLLLWALFSGSTSLKYTESPLQKPLKGSELQRLQDEEGRDTNCPDPWWLPDECLSEQRTKSKTTLDRCNEIFEEYEYSIELLKKCGIISFP